MLSLSLNRYFDLQEINYFDNNFITIYHSMYSVYGLSIGKLYNFWDRQNNKFRALSEVIIQDDSRPFPVGIKTPEVVKFVQKHFNCPTMDYAPLENFNDFSVRYQHWEMFFFGNDMANAQVYFNHPISGVNFAFLTDTGTYFGLTEYAEHLAWAERAGCGLLSGKCEDNPVTCQPGAHLCSPDYFSVVRCDSKHFAEGCHLPQELPHGDCRHPSNKLDFVQGEKIENMHFGYGARCVVGKPFSGQSFEQGNCVETICGSDYRSVVYKISGKEYTCDSKNQGQKVDLGEGRFFRCPDDVYKVCRPELNCPNDCSMNGRCKSGVSASGDSKPWCWCYDGFSGPDCSIRDHQCQEGCLTCDHNDGNKCYQCDSAKGFKLTQNTCCASDQVFSEGHCCPLGQQWSNGICCGSGLTNQGGICCGSGLVNKDGICCSESQHNSNGICCSQGYSNSGEKCCKNGFLNSGGICCEAGKTNKGGVCCLESEHNSNGVCCGAGMEESGGVCCPAGQANSGGLCCPSGTENRNGNCCNPSCASCLPESPSTCSGCPTGFNPLNGLCCRLDEYLVTPEKCGPPTACPKGTWPDPDTRKCLKCAENCVECHGSGADQCTQCNPNIAHFGLSGGRCQCLEGFFQAKDDTKGAAVVCKACHESCSKCASSGSDQCLACKNQDEELIPSLSGASRPPTKGIMGPGAQQGLKSGREQSAGSFSATGTCHNCYDNYIEELCKNLIQNIGNFGLKRRTPDYRSRSVSFTSPGNSLVFKGFSQPTRNDFKNYVTITFPEEVIDLIDALGDDFDVTDLFYIDVEGLKHTEDYQVKSRVYEDRLGIEVYFHYREGIDMDNRKFKVSFDVRDPNYFLKNFEKAKKNLEEKQRSNANSGQKKSSGLSPATPSTPSGTKGRLKLVRIQKKRLEGEIIIETTQESKFKKSAEFLGFWFKSLILGYIGLFILGAAVISASKWIYFIGRHFRALLYCQFIVKLALVGVNHNPSMLAFLDHLYAIDILHVMPLKKENEVRLAVGGKFKEYSVPVLGINSVPFTIVFFFFCLVLTLTKFGRRGRDMGEKERSKLNLVTSLLVFKLLDTTFYAFFSVVNHRYGGDGVHFWSLFSLVVSILTLLCCLLVVFVGLFGFYRRKGISEGIRSMSVRRDMEKYAEFPYSGDNLKYVLQLFLIVLVQEKGDALIYCLLLVQVGYVGYKLVQACVSRAFESRWRFLFSLLSEGCVLLILGVFHQIHSHSFTWSSKELWFLTKIAIFLFYMSFVFEVVCGEVVGVVEFLVKDKGNISNKDEEVLAQDQQYLENGGSVPKNSKLSGSSVYRKGTSVRTRVDGLKNVDDLGSRKSPLGRDLKVLKEAAGSKIINPYKRTQKGPSIGLKGPVTKQGKTANLVFNPYKRRNSRQKTGLWKRQGTSPSVPVADSIKNTEYGPLTGAPAAPLSGPHETKAKQKQPTTSTTSRGLNLSTSLVLDFDNLDDDKPQKSSRYKMKFKEMRMRKKADRKTTQIPVEKKRGKTSLRDKKSSEGSHPDPKRRQRRRQSMRKTGIEFNPRDEKSPQK